jgi:hypothetical protein
MQKKATYRPYVVRVDSRLSPLVFPGFGPKVMVLAHDRQSRLHSLQPQPYVLRSARLFQISLLEPFCNFSCWPKYRVCISIRVVAQPNRGIGIAGFMLYPLMSFFFRPSAWFVHIPLQLRHPLSFRGTRSLSSSNMCRISLGS